MRITNLIFFVFLLSVLLITACVPAHVKTSNKQGFTKKITISLPEQLDALYQQNKPQWDKKMRNLIMSGHENIPIRHLVHSMYLFNRFQDRNVCLEASFLYLEQKSRINHHFHKDDRLLFSKLVEYVLRTPDTFDTNRIKLICQDVQDSICDELK